MHPHTRLSEVDADSTAARAHVVDDHLPDQGWCRLCNGVVLFDDGHYLTPDGHDHLLPLSA